MKKAIAIDIGGTKTHGALIDEFGKLLKDIKIPTNPSLGADYLLNSLYEICENLMENDLCGIGVGSAGRINIEDGSVFYATDNIPGWTNVKIKQLLEERFQIPVKVDNDVNAAGLGEEWMGSGKGYNSYVCLTLGTGIGAAIKMNGELIHGAHHSAGEIGHMCLYPDGRACNCGLNGCFEQYCSGTAITKKYNELSENKIRDGKEFFHRLQKDDKLCKKIMEEFIHDLSTALISLCNIYDPEVFIIGGGLIETKEFWWDDMIKNIQASALSNVFKIKILPARLGNLAGLYGAASLVL